MVSNLIMACCCGLCPAVVHGFADNVPVSGGWRVAVDVGVAATRVGVLVGRGVAVAVVPLPPFVKIAPINTCMLSLTSPDSPFTLMLGDAKAKVVRVMAQTKMVRRRWGLLLFGADANNLTMRKV